MYVVPPSGDGVQAWKTEPRNTRKETRKNTELILEICLDLFLCLSVSFSVCSVVRFSKLELHALIGYKYLSMVRRIGTFLFSVILLCNLLAVFPVEAESDEGCSTECCTAVDGAVRPFCIIECRQSAEIPPPSTRLLAAAPSRIAHSPSWATSVLLQADYARQTRFPSSPTRAINGSSARYLDCGSLLI